MKHKLQFLIGDHVLPYNMTVYQAIRQYSPLVNDQSETDTDTETPIGEFLLNILSNSGIFIGFLIKFIGSASIWVQQHTIYYRPMEDNQGTSASKGASSTATTSASGTFNSSRKNNKNSNPKIMSRRKPEFWVDGIAPPILSPLSPFLVPKLPDILTVDDASLDVLVLLRILNGLNRHWSTLYYSVPQLHIIPQSEFIHSKVGHIFTKFYLNSLIFFQTLNSLEFSQFIN